MAQLRLSTRLLPLHFKCTVIKACIYLRSLLAVRLPVSPLKSRQLLQPRASVRFSHCPPLPLGKDSSLPGVAKGGVPGLPQPSTSTGAGNWREVVLLRLEQAARSPVDPGARLTWPTGVCRSIPQLHVASRPQQPLEQRQTNTGELFALGKGCTATLVWNNRWF